MIGGVSCADRTLVFVFWVNACVEFGSAVAVTVPGVLSLVKSGSNPWEVVAIRSVACMDWWSVDLAFVTSKLVIASDVVTPATSSCCVVVSILVVILLDVTGSGAVTASCVVKSAMTSVVVLFDVTGSGVVIASCVVNADV